MIRVALVLLVLATPVRAEDADSRGYVESLIAQERALREEQFRATQEAVAVARETMGHRLEVQNNLLEFLEKKLDESQGKFATGEGQRALEKRIAALESDRDTWKGGAYALWAAGGAAVALLVAWGKVFRGGRL